MFRQLLSLTTAVSLLLPPSVRSNELPLPLNRVWKGIVECTDGYRGFALISVDTKPNPLEIVMLGPRPKDGPNAHGGVLLADVIPDARGVHLSVTKVLIPMSSIPNEIGGHIDPKDGAFYGGVTGAPGCNYVEALVGTDPDSQAHLQFVTADPQRYLDELTKATKAPTANGHSAQDWIGLAFAGLVIVGIAASLGSGGSGKSGKKGWYEPDYDQPNGGGRAPSVGGNAHGNGPADAHGNPWQGTGSGPALGQDVHGN